MQTVRVTFSNDLGEQYVDMRSFRVVPWKLAKKFNAIGGVRKDGDNVVMDDGAAVEFAETVTLDLVVGGHVYNAYTGELMTFPLTSESVQEAPVEMLMAVAQKFGEMKAENDPKN